MARAGTSLERFEDLALLRGDGRFADDLGEPPGCLHAAFLRSPLAHARIERIDVARAAAMPGVAAVATGADIARLTRPLISGVKLDAPHYPLAVDRARYVGEPVAVVAAADRYLAEDALDAIDVAYAPLPAVVDAEAALAPGAPVLHEGVGSNLLHERRFRYGDPEAAFAGAAHVVEARVRYPRNSCTPVETFVVLAGRRPGEDAYEVTANFQGPYTLHTVMARALRVPGNRLRLRTPPDSGGSFGTKQAVFPAIVALGIAARLAGRPVKWVEDRLEHLAAATSATGRATTLRMALDAEGRVLALDYDQVEDCGAWLRAPEPATLYRMQGNMTGAYAIRHVAIRNRVAATNKTPTGLMRGFGGPQVYFALERAMDLAAARLGLDPVEIRRRNLVPGAAMPHATAPGAVLDSGDYPATLDRAAREGGLDELRRRRDAARAGGRLYGIGCAAVVEPSISNMGYIAALLTPEERARAGPKNGALAWASVGFDPSGAVTATAASVPQGQGHRTALAQTVAGELGIDPAEVAVATDHDTGKDPWSIASGNYSSRFAGAVAGAAKLAAARVAGRLRAIAAPELNVPPEEVELADGMARAAGNPDNAVAIGRIAAKAHWSPLSVPEAAGAGLRETVFWTPPELREPDGADRVNSSAAHGFLFDFCGVEVDRTDGSVRVDRYVTAHDAGRLLNPALADGQIRGGFLHGLGAALYEELAYAPDGAFLAGTFADYCPPYATEAPDLAILHDEHPSPVTPTGAKGLGEGNCMSTPVCIANAVADAIGKPVETLPLTRPRVLALIGEAEPPDPLAGRRRAGLPEVAPPPGAGRALSGAGSATVALAPEEVWDTMLDPARLAALVPGCRELEADGPNAWRAVASLGAGPVRGRFAARIELSGLDPPRALELSGTAEGPLGTAAGRAAIALAPEGGGTRLDYAYAIRVSGKAAAVGGRLLDGAARALVAEGLARLAARGGDGATAGARPGADGWLARLRRWFGGRR